MAKQKLPAAESSIVEFINVKDGAYKQALANDKNELTLSAFADFVRVQHPQFIEQGKDHPIYGELCDGYISRFTETDTGKDREYAVINGKYIDVSSLTKRPASVEIISAEYCRNLSNYDLRMLEKDNPEKHKVVKSLRNDASTYISQRVSALLKKIEFLNNPPKDGEKKRKANLTFRESLAAFFEKSDGKVKLDKKRGDPDADPVRYRMAVESFWQTFDKK